MKETEIFTREEMLIEIDNFNTLYEERPIKNNNGGMKSSHLFYSWFVMNKLKPKHIIESGVWKGLGTWFFEKASPNSEIISIDPFLNNREYISENVTYITTDFEKNNWDEIDKENCVIFLDDHQNSLGRLQHAKNLGFKRIIVEDNYPPSRGDAYSPKKIISKNRYIIDRPTGTQWYDPKKEDYDYFVNVVNKYQEFPPLFKDDYTRWGDKWDEENYPTNKQLLNDNLKYSTFYDERKDYTWICYLELF